LIGAVEPKHEVPPAFFEIDSDRTLETEHALLKHLMRVQPAHTLCRNIRDEIEAAGVKPN